MKKKARLKIRLDLLLLLLLLLLVVVNTIIELSGLDVRQKLHVCLGQPNHHFKPGNKPIKNSENINIYKIYIAFGDSIGATE